MKLERHDASTAHETPTHSSGHPDFNLPQRMVRDILTVRRIFGDAYQDGETTIIPVATTRGRSGFGYGAHDHQHAVDADLDASNPENGGARGGGTGFTASIRPVGVYVISDGIVSWRPIIDINRAIRGGQIFAVASVFAAAYVLGRTLRRPR